jgi:hypothetical protein
MVPWHPAYVKTAEMEVEKDGDRFTVKSEFTLAEAPLRI